MDHAATFSHEHQAESRNARAAHPDYAEGIRDSGPAAQRSPVLVALAKTTQSRKSVEPPKV